VPGSDVLTASGHVDAVSVRGRLAALARVAGAPVVTVYLNTRWSDEHQRERVRGFVRHEAKRARQDTRDAALLDDLAWVEAEAERVIDQARFADASGIALFASGPLGLREVVPVGVPFDDAFFVGDRPVLTPLTEVLDEAPATLVVFIDGTSARLIPVDGARRGEEVTLQHAVERRHRRGGWALLAQSRYQRQIEQQRARHFEAVAAAVSGLVQDQTTEHIVLAGESRAVAALREHLPPAITARIVGTVSAARHEAAAELADRAALLIAETHRADEDRAVERLITDAAKNGRAVVGVTPTVEAVMRGAVHRLYVLKDLADRARACRECGGLFEVTREQCARCAAPTQDVKLTDALVERVLAAGGDVEVVPGHPDLARAGGVGARLRYPLATR
jgi:peptide subunit release factor 1 (eRF1)